MQKHAWTCMEVQADNPVVELLAANLPVVAFAHMDPATYEVAAHSS